MSYTHKKTQVQRLFGSKWQLLDRSSPDFQRE